MQQSFRKRHLLAVAACWFGIVISPSAAFACSLVEFQDDGRYVGGSLVEQIARKADTIQIVTVKAKYLVRRTFIEGDWYLQFGDRDVPEGHPEFIDEFVFELAPVETLKIGGDPSGPIYENHPRMAGYDPSVFRRTPEGTAAPGARHPNSLPDWLLDRPGDDGYAFIGAAEGTGLGGGECSSPYVLEVGQTFVALRDSIGRLYPASGAFPLKVDVRFVGGSGRAESLALNMQSLIPVNGPDDPFLSRLRQAVAADGPDR